MKNVKESQLKTCIFIPLDEFKELVTEVSNGNLSAEYELDGLYYSLTDDAIATGSKMSTVDLYNKLSEHFDVIVTSVHADDCEYLGVWICYKDGGDKHEE